MTDLNLESLLAARPAASASRGRLTLGRVIDGWRVEAYLGAGRSSEVYRVVSTRFGGEGALKLLADESHGLKARFLREMDVLRSLSCPSLPRFFGSGELDGRPYYVMEYLQPLFLPLDRTEVVPFADALARSVGDLHAAGYVHRDLKPANILRRRTGEPVLIDLGLVRKIGETGNDGVGTMGYAAPEQLLRGESTVRADVFALGKILRAAGGKHLTRRLRGVVRKATHEDPDERYPTAAAFAAAVRGRKLSLVWCLSAASVLVLLGLAGAFLSLTTAGSSRPGLLGQLSTQPRPEVAGGGTVTGDCPTTAGSSRPGLLETSDDLVLRAENLFHGRGCATNLEESVRLYRLAAETGHPGAQDSLGLCLLRGLGCATNEAEAVRWFTAAAEQEHPSAMNNLAFCHMNGKGVPRDAHKGFIWAKLAAEKGHAPSQTLVGECYLDGRGVEADQDQALIWLRLAARKGNQRARLLLQAFPRF